MIPVTTHKTLLAATITEIRHTCKIDHKLSDNNIQMILSYNARVLMEQYLFHSAYPSCIWDLMVLDGFYPVARVETKSLRFDGKFSYSLGRRLQVSFGIIMGIKKLHKSSTVLYLDEI